MPSPILSQRNLDGVQVYFLTGRFFTHSGTRFEIIGTVTTGPKIYDCIHLVKNIQSGNVAELTAIRLITLLKECTE